MAFYDKEITDKILSCFYRVYNKLGYGFLEKVYENALCFEIQKLGLRLTQQGPIKVHYENTVVGDFVCDLIVEDKVIVEIKAVKELRKEHDAQLLNYLKATRLDVGLLLNFGLKPEFSRRAYTYNR